MSRNGILRQAQNAASSLTRNSVVTNNSLSFRSLSLSLSPSLRQAKMSTTTPASKGHRRHRPIITLEEHFLSTAALSSPSTMHPHTAFLLKSSPDLSARLADLGQRRIEDMDAGQVTLQVISHGPGDLDAEQCRMCNDQLADAIRAQQGQKKTIGRFAGFAELPMGEPDEAAKELRRVCAGDFLFPSTSTTSLKPGSGGGFVGALVDSHTESGQYYDSPAYDSLWAAAVDLDVPIYIHPTWPSDQLAASYYSSPELPGLVNASIGAFGWGWHSDVAVHVLRLYGAGVFDRFPRLKIILGHMGEMLPFMLQRVERVTGRWPAPVATTTTTTASDNEHNANDKKEGGTSNKRRTFRQVWDENIWITTSGNWALDPLACILRNTKHDRIMYSVDYPFTQSADGLPWLEELEASGMVSEEVLEGIRWRNAARLLKLDLDLDLDLDHED